MHATPISQISRGELDNCTVTVKRYGVDIPKFSSSAEVREVAQIAPDLSLCVDRDAGCVFVIGHGRSCEAPRLDEKGAFDLVAKVLAETRDARETVQSLRVLAAGCFLHESLTGSEPALTPGHKDSFDIAARLSSQVTGRVIYNMIAPADQRYPIESAAVILHELAHAEPRPDPEPDPGDRALLVELTRRFTPTTSKLIRATAITEPSRELAQQWLTESQRMLNELVGDALTPDVSGELTNLAEHFATSSLDDPEYLAEQSRDLAGALLANWVSTLGELLLIEPTIQLQEDLWPSLLPAEHATEYRELLDQYALTPEAVVPAWREWGEMVTQSLDLPNRLRLLRLDTTRFAVFSPERQRPG